MPGLELRLPLLFTEGVQKGRISLQQFVALTATNHARLYGLYPRKGTIAVGSDADIAIWDPDKDVTIRWKDLHDNVGYTPYEGREIKAGRSRSCPAAGSSSRTASSTPSAAAAASSRARPPMRCARSGETCRRPPS